VNNKTFNFGPIALTNTLTTNILNPPTASGGINGGSSSQYIIITHFRVVSKITGLAKVSLWKGATGANAAGTEFLWNSTPVQPNQSIEVFGRWRFDAADFLVGGSDTATALSIEGEGEIGVSG
jgi:hypothetical protein